MGVERAGEPESVSYATPYGCFSLYTRRQRSRLILFGAVGAFLATLYPPIAEIMLAVAGIGLFFVVGWWAIIAAPFLLVAALLTFSNQRVSVPGAE